MTGIASQGGVQPFTSVTGPTTQPQAPTPSTTGQMEQTAIKAGGEMKEIHGVGASSSVQPMDKTNMGPAVPTKAPELAQQGVETAAARFKSGSPGFVFQNPDAKAVYSTAIQARVDTDKADMKACIEGGRIDTLRSSTVASTSCSKLMDANRELFGDAGKLKEKWEEFKASPHGQACAKDLKGPPPESKELTPTFELSAKGYHNEYHANEMYADTVVKLHREGMSESLCIAGGTMAYFHDLIQGLDGFPGLGKNENVTAKFLNFLIDEEVKKGTIDEETATALKSLSDATIVGGTFLVGVMQEGGGKNQTPSECMDSSDLKTTGHEQDYEDLSKMRHMMARNDISRTQESDYTVRPDKSQVDESTPQGKMIGSCYDAKAEAFDQRSQAIQSNPAFQKLGIPQHQFARVCQSVRMLTEILPKAPGSNFNEKAVVDHIRNNVHPPDQNYEASMQQLIGKLKNPVTWSGGMVQDKFVPGEAQFAKPSGHEEYAKMLMSDEFKQALSTLSDEDVESLIRCALSDIQDGQYIGKSLQQTS